MNHIAGRALLATCIACAGAAVVLACTSFGEDTAAQGEGGTPPALDGGGCPDKAFCDSFDDTKKLPRDWTTIIENDPDRIRIYPEAGLDGSGGLVAIAKTSTGTQRTLLSLDRGAHPASYGFVLSFAAKVIVDANGQILGPRLFAISDQGIRHDISVAFQNGKAKLIDYEADCDSGCFKVNEQEYPVGTDWHRFVMRGQVRAGAAGDYGSLTFEVDGNTVVTGPLPISLATGRNSGLEFGLTFALPTTVGAITLDDVTLTFTD